MNKATTLTDAQVRYLINFVLKDITGWLMDDYGYSTGTALEIVYNSLFYEKLSDRNTGLYFQSSGYNYALLQEELKYGKIA